MQINSDSLNDQKRTKSSIGTKATVSVIKPKLINEEVLRNDFSIEEHKGQHLLRDFGRYAKKRLLPNKEKTKSFLLNIAPIVTWLSNYKWKECFLKDFIGGLTLGVVLIPQSMGYSLNGGLPSYQGLYSVPIAMYLYLIFGTATHVALGIFGAVTLLLKRITDDFDGHLFSSQGVNSTNFISNDPMTARVLISSNIAFWAGIIQVIFAITRFGTFFTKYLSDIIVIAYASATAYIIVITQFFSLLGITNTGKASQFELIENLITIFENLHKTNPATLIISLVCMLSLYLVKHFINEKFKKKMIAPVPIEFIILLSSILLSYYVGFNKKWNVKIIGAIPIGYPPPVIPKFKFFTDLILPSFNIAIVSYSINVSIAKLFSRKYNYSFQPDKESLVYGCGNVFLSFFQGVPLCGGLSRCAILEGIGIKTPLYMLYSATIIMVVIYSLAPYFNALPVAALASIISVSLLSLCREISQVKNIYMRSKTEGIAFAVTWVGVICLNVDYGLYIAMIVSLAMIIFQNQRAYASLLGNVPKTHIYEILEICKEAKEIQGIKIIRFESSLFYANIERFEYILKKLSGVDPYFYLKKINAEKEKFKRIKETTKAKKGPLDRIFKRRTIATIENPIHDPENNTQNHSEKYALDSEIENIKSRIDIQYIVIDMSCVNTIDNQAINAIRKLNDAYKHIGITVCFSYTKRTILRAFDKANLKAEINYGYIFPTTHDAVVAILHESDNSHILVSNYHIHIAHDLDADVDSDEISEAEDAIIEPKYQERHPSIIVEDESPAFNHLIEHINL